jgi:WS/DGAT/MGAT family acyltransferase
VPALRRRPEDSPRLRARPVWVDDDDPSVEHHVRTLSVAAPGSLRQVLDLVGLLESVPFDPERSPWDVTTIDGLEDGRGALYIRAHHVLTDGLGGIRLLSLLLDEPGWPRTDAEPAATEVRTEAPRSDDGDRRPGTLTMTIDLPKVARRVAGGVNAARDVDPVDTALRGVQRALSVANSVSRQLIVTGGPLAASPPARSLLSRLEAFSVSGARSTARALGGSRNDLLIAAAAAGLGRYHDQLGEPCLMLRLATPTSQRRVHEMGGNWFAPTRVEIPTAVGRPGPQFGVVVERLAQARREPALRVATTLAAAVGRLPARVLLPALHAQAESVDFAATTLPGLRRSRHVCGSRIEDLYPFGPRLGCPMNITAFGRGEGLDIGVALDPMAVSEPELLVECLEEAFRTYAAVAGTSGDEAGSPPTVAALPLGPAATE